jgi:eukaryotic-like serine/threonine-protein kinase
MATVHVGRLLGPVGFSRTVAIKRLHPQFERDPEFVAMFLDEARIAARIRHPNVVQTLDVVASDGELLLVMDYVEGESLARLLRAAARAGQPVPPARIVLAIVCGALQGLHAAHEAKGEDGRPLGVVHRDVSPQNILVCVDGTPRVLDFGIAKAIGRLQATRSGEIKGKLSYMAPEQIRNGQVTRRTDVYAAGVVLWEALTGARLFRGEEGPVIGQILEGRIDPPSQIEPTVPAVLDPIVMRALSANPEARYATALEMARELGRSMALAPALELAEWVNLTASTQIAERAAVVLEVESVGSNPKELDDSGSLEPKTRPRAIDPAPSAASDPGREVATETAWYRRSAPRMATAAALAGVSVALAVALVIAVILLVRGRSQVEPTTGSSVAASASEPTVLSPLATVEPTPPPSSVPPASSLAARTARTPVAAAKAPSSPSTLSTQKKPAADRCKPPFYVDKDGIKTYKPGCAL